MVVTQTSINSYIALLPELNNMENRVFEVFKNAPKGCRLTDRDIAKFLQCTINRVTGRRNKLVKKGYLEPAGVTYDFETNIHVQTWRLSQGV